MPQLTVVKLRAIKPSGKIERYHDTKGLYLEVSTAGKKAWRLKYRFGGKEKRLTFGAWPDVSLEEARAKRDAARKILSEGADPGASDTRKKSGQRTFRSVADEFVGNQKKVWAPRHTETVESRLKNDVLPFVGDLPIDDLLPTDILAIIRRIEARGALEVASRVLGICSLIFRYGVAIGACPSDPCRDLRGALAPRKKGQFAAITKPKEVGALMRSIDGCEGSAIVKAALLFSALTFCRA